MYTLKKICQGNYKCVYNIITWNICTSKKIWLLNLYNIAPTVASLPPVSLCSNFLDTMLSSDAGTRTVQITFPRLLCQLASMTGTTGGCRAWRRGRDFLPHFCSCHCCYSNDRLHPGETVGPRVHLLMALQDQFHHVLKQMPATASWCPFLIDLRADPERPPLRATEAPGTAAQHAPPPRPDGHRTPSQAPGCFRFVVPLSGVIYFLHLFLGSLSILFEQILT